MPLVKSVSVKISADGTEDAKLKIDQVAVKAEELKKINPEITPKIDSAKALLEARLLREGLKAELSKAITEKVDVKQSLFSRALEASGLGPNGGNGLFAGLDNLPMGGLGGIAAALPVVSALAVEAAALATGFAAAAGGVGAFGLLALPTFKKVSAAYTSISAAQTAYNKAVALEKVDPTKTNATAVATALAKLKAAQDVLPPSTKAAVDGIHDLVGAFDKLAAAFQPQVMKVFNDGLKIANQLLPDLKGPAQAAATAIDGLLKKLSGFVASKGFKDWLAHFDTLIGPSITAIGTGVGKVLIAIGKLVTKFSGHDVAHAINIFFDTIAGAINGIVWVIGRLMNSWDRLSGGMKEAWKNIEKWSAQGASVVVGAVQILVDKALGFFQTFIDGGAKLFGWVPGVGPKLKSAATAFDNWKASVDKSLSDAQSSLDRFANSLDSLNGKTVRTYVLVNTQNVPYRVQPRASGGPASGLTLVGERGPELLSVPAGSYVYNNSQSRQMMGGGGNHYTINVAVPVSANKKDVGREIVNAIRAFEKGSGSSWRRTA